MRLSFFITLSILLMSVHGQGQVKTSLKTFNGNSFYSISENTNQKLIIFLHGGLNNPYFKQATDSIELNFLVEENTVFLAQAELSGFDVIVPITNDSLNWLENPELSFSILKNIVEQSNGEYREIYISGFSDGGTGSFKIFYQNPDYFDGLVVFNGYPQHKNYYKGVDYKMITDKKVIFMGSFNDKVIPYEFLLTEYCTQKKYNPNTFIYLTSGGHSFANYTEADIKELFDILSDKNQNKEMEPIQGFIRNDQLIHLYPFRKMVVRKFGFGKIVYEENRKQSKKYKK